MWLLSSRGRPKLCQEVLDACADTKMSSSGIVYVDTRVSDYPNLKLPSNWTKVLGDKDLAPSKQEFYEQHLDEKFYGFLADDVVPKTEYFDKKFEEAAGDWFFVDCDDGGYAKREAHIREDLPVPLSGAHMWGAELVHTVGWWALPGIRQFTTGNAWTYLMFLLENGLSLSLRKHLSDVVVEHKNWRTDKRPKDETDDWEREGKNYRDSDFAVYERCRLDGTFNRLAKKIKRRYTKTEKALVLIDVWDKDGLSFQKSPIQWEESVQITQDKLLPVLTRARKEGWVIIHCHSGFNPLPEVAPILGEYEVPYDAPIHAHCPNQILESVSVIYFVGFHLNICVLGNLCGIKQTHAFMPKKKLVLLEDCTKATTAGGNTEAENFEVALNEIRGYCEISTSDKLFV